MINRCRSALLIILLYGAGLLCFSTMTWAQGLEVSPILVQLSAGQMTTTLSVTNRDAVKAGLQLRPFIWDQSGGIDNLTPTTELAVSPPITEVEAGQTQIFRVVLRHPATGKESSYRLLLDQLPTANSAGSVLIVLRLSIPVFVEPTDLVQTNVAWRLVADKSGSLLEGINRGGAHLRILKPVLALPDGQRLPVAIGQSPYILSGAERSWHIQTGNTLRPGATLRLIAESDGGPIDAVVHVSAP